MASGGTMLYESGVGGTEVRLGLSQPAVHPFGNAERVVGNPAIDRIRQIPGCCTHIRLAVVRQTPAQHGREAAPRMDPEAQFRITRLVRDPQQIRIQTFSLIMAPQLP